jgi:hypothetical protein
MIRKSTMMCVLYAVQYLKTNSWKHCILMFKNYFPDVSNDKDKVKEG